MTNYIPTRADELKVGDVVRWPDWFDGEKPIDDLWVDDRRFLHLRFGDFEITVDYLPVLDRRVTPDEYERLSAPF